MKPTLKELNIKRKDIYSTYASDRAGQIGADHLEKLGLLPFNIKNQRSRLIFLLGSTVFWHGSHSESKKSQSNELTINISTPEHREIFTHLFETTDLKHNHQKNSPKGKRLNESIKFDSRISRILRLIGYPPSLRKDNIIPGYVQMALDTQLSSNPTEKEIAASQNILSDFFNTLLYFRANFDRNRVILNSCSTEEAAHQHGDKTILTAQFSDIETVDAESLWLTGPKKTPNGLTSYVISLAGQHNLNREQINQRFSDIIQENLS